LPPPRHTALWTVVVGSPVDAAGLALARAFLQEMYAETQAYFARIGVTEVRVWRGLDVRSLGVLGGRADRRGCGL